MRRRLAALTVAAALSTLTACGGSDGSTATPPTHTDEQAFLDATAQHLCTVQSRVYDDAAALSAAYDAKPDVPGLSAAAVSALKERLTTDPAFSQALLDQVTATCG